MLTLGDPYQEVRVFYAMRSFRPFPNHHSAAASPTHLRKSWGEEG